MQWPINHHGYDLRSLKDSSMAELLPETGDGVILQDCYFRGNDTKDYSTSTWQSK